jgi:hypothetical protein
MIFFYFTILGTPTPYPQSLPMNLKTFNAQHSNPKWGRDAASRPHPVPTTKAGSPFPRAGTIQLKQPRSAGFSPLHRIFLHTPGTILQQPFGLSVEAA